MKKKHSISIVVIGLFLTQAAYGSTYIKLCADYVGNEVKINHNAVNLSIPFCLTTDFLECSYTEIINLIKVKWMISHHFMCSFFN